LIIERGEVELVYEARSEGRELGEGTWLVR
jgi:hypothetical protein